MVDSE
jgi:hypothetical protein